MLVRKALAPFVFALAAVGCSEAPEPAKAPPPANWESRPITVQEVRFPALNQAIGELKGKVVVVDFWATWCAPCVKKFPHLVEVQKRFADRGVVCVSVSEDKRNGTLDMAKVQEYLTKWDARFPNFVLADYDADEAELHKRFGLSPGIPYLVVLDRNGEPVWNSDDSVKVRKDEAKELDAFLEKLTAAK